MHGLLIHGPIKYIDHQEEEEDACDKVEKPEKFSDRTLQAGVQPVGDIFHDSHTATRLFAGAKQLVPTFDMVFKHGNISFAQTPGGAHSVHIHYQRMESASAAVSRALFLSALGAANN